MGVVWTAEDTRLGRQVAVKLLSPEFAADTERLARFDREARLLASLNHPNIGALYAIEESGGERFLVLELIPGGTLAERIDHGPLPIDEALATARQIAVALAAAHAAGVLHRDLKPANVKVTPDGKVKVLDFGLAKSFATGEKPAADPSMSPTITALGTQAGVILGTAAYMSPEQARGRGVDRRADIWGLGCILYEMLAGRRPFRGETVSDTLASVLKDDPDWSALPPALPPAGQRLLRRLLAKDPSRRLHDVADAILDLDEAIAEEAAGPGTAIAPAAAAPRWRMLLPWALLVVACAAAAWSARQALRPATLVPSLAVTASILPPAEGGFAIDRGLALSPDGSQLVAAVRGADGVLRLWLRHLSRGTGQIMAGTDGAGTPFWSPDGRRVAFFSAGNLKTVEPESGVVESIAPCGERPTGGSWSASGGILIGHASGGDGSILRIPAGGGKPVPATQPERTRRYHQWPSFLPDGRHFLYLVRDYSGEERLGEIHLGSLDGGVSPALFPANSNAVYAAPGFLVWWHDGNLRAQRFDADRLTLQGEPFALAAGARFDPRNGYAAFAISGSGGLVYQEATGKAGNELAWVDREGHDLGLLAPTASYYGPRISPDGARVATDISDDTNRGDIWLLDVARGAGTRFTSWPEDDSSPIWSPDGDEVAFFSSHGGGHEAVYVRPVRGADEPHLVVKDDEADLDPTDWSRDGSILIERIVGANTTIWVYSTRDRSFRPFHAGNSEERAGAFSPDGRLVAFSSDETGRTEVYLATFPEAGERWRVSTEGGGQPVWRSDGGELYYFSLDGRIMAVPIEKGAPGSAAGSSGPPLGTPRPLFRVDLKEHERAQFDTIDGRRFLMNRNVSTGATHPLTLVLHALDRAEH